MGSLTHTTDQERAEFEAWARSVGLPVDQAGFGLYAKVETQAAWMAWQWKTARRAPAAPVPQGLREAAQAVVERWDTPLWKDVPATAVYIADLRAALAAAPQPPEAAPVQLPEPSAWMLGCQTIGGDVGWKLSWSKSGAGVCHRLSGEEFEQPLYTEHQVRQLLANHGIQEQST